MPVLLATLFLGLSSDYVFDALQDVHPLLAVVVVLLCALLLGAAMSHHRQNLVIVSEDVDCVKKKSHKTGSLTESFSVVAALGFLYFSYMLLLSNEHRIRLVHFREKAYLSRVHEFSPFQMFSVVGLSLCFLTLITLAGMGLVNVDNEKKRKSSSSMSRVEAFSVVCLVLQLIALGCVTCLHLYRAMFYSGQFAESIWGLTCGLFFAGVGQVCVLLYHYVRRELHWFPMPRLQQQQQQVSNTSFVNETIRHVSKPSSLLMIGSYLVLSWVLKLLPPSYYEETHSVEWFHVVLQLLVVDVFTYFNHRAEHSLSALFIPSHKPHHRFTSPTLFDAFDGTTLDTFFLILLPLFVTGQIVHVAHTWSYIAFGFVYSTHFMLIHSEWPHAGDSLASKFGLYTAQDHHVHHSRFVFNYAHFFTFWDRLCGTYQESL